MALVLSVDWLMSARAAVFRLPPNSASSSAPSGANAGRFGRRCKPEQDRPKDCQNEPQRREQAAQQRMP